MFWNFAILFVILLGGVTMPKIYLASLKDMNLELVLEKGLLEKLNVLQSFFYASDEITRYIHKFRSFMLDSGGLTAQVNPAVKVDWNEYLERYAQYIVENKIELFFELDIDKVVGKKVVSKLRERLEELTGRLPIWVFQAGRTLDEFQEALKKYRYFAIPLSRRDEESRRRRYRGKLRLRTIVEMAHDAGAKIHGLGFTPHQAKELLAYGFDSTDSTTWLRTAVAGIVCEFQGDKVVQIKDRWNKIVKTHVIAQHNFLEWLKFVELMEAKNGAKNHYRQGVLF